MKRNLLHFANKRFPDEKREMLERSLIQIAEGLKFLHSKNIVHRDMKPSNILYDFLGNWKITDFGLSRHVNTSMTANCGTNDYRAPEQSDRHYDCKVDIYALGLIAFEIGYPMETRESKREWFRKFRESSSTQTSFPDSSQRLPNFSPALDNLISGMIRTCPEERLPLDKVIYILKISNSKCQNKFTRSLSTFFSTRTDLFNDKYARIRKEYVTEEYKYASVDCRDTNERREIELLSSNDSRVQEQINLLLGELKPKHENIIRCFGIWRLETELLSQEWKKNFGELISKESELYAIETELCLGTLSEFLDERNLSYFLGQDLEETNIVLMRCMKQIGHGLKFLHSLNILHRNLNTYTIKCDSKGNWKLCDIGRAIVSESTCDDAMADVAAYGMIIFQICYPCNPITKDIQLEDMKRCPPQFPDANERIKFFSSDFDEIIRFLIDGKASLDQAITFLENSEPNKYQNIFNHSRTDAITYETELFNQMFEFGHVLDTGLRTASAFRTDQKEKRAIKLSYGVQDDFHNEISLFRGQKLKNENIIQFFGTIRVTEKYFNEEWTTFFQRCHISHCDAVLEFEVYVGMSQHRLKMVFE